MLLLTFCLLVPPEQAPPPRPAPTPVEKLAAIQQDLERVQVAVRKRIDTRSVTVEEQQRGMAKQSAALQAAVVRAVELAEAHPRSADGLAALEWALSHITWHSPSAPPNPTVVRAVERFTTEYAATSPDAVRGVAAALASPPSAVPPDLAGPRDRLIAAAERNPARAVRGQVALARARWATNAFLAADRDGRSDAARLTGPMDALLDRLEKEFGDCPDAWTPQGKVRPTTLGQMADALRPKVRTNHPAPPIAGVDLDGKPLDLADYRGKVVLLVRWGFRNMTPGTQSLRTVGERYKGRPFAVVGLTLHTEPSPDRTAWEASAPGWRSLAEPRTREPGPLARTWAQLDYGPSVAVVIDHRGVVRDRRPYPAGGRRGGVAAEPNWPVDLLDELVDAAEGKEPPSPAQRMETAVKAGKELEEQFDRELRAAKDRAASLKANEDHGARTEVWASSALRLLRQHPSESAAFDLIADRNLYVPAEEKVGILKAHHWANPRMDSLVYAMAQHDPAERAFVDQVCENHPNRAVRGRACLDNGRITRIYLLALDKPRTGFRKIGTREELKARAMKYLTLAVEHYGDVPGRDGGTVGELAAGELAGLKNRDALKVGGTAPDLAGEDLDGKPLKLSEYRRGRVCLVVFWGSWCGPCLKMVPKERALAEKYDPNDFCILGVNGRDEKAKAVAAAEKHQMTWPSVWDEGRSGGPRAAAWNVTAWPTVYLIDRAGVVLYVGHGDDLEAAVEKAVTDRPKSATPPR